MTPYLTAWRLYTAHERETPWTDALEIHLQRGAVLSSPDGFVMLRRVGDDWPDAWHLDLHRVATCGNCWHVWAAAGSMRAMAEFAALLQVQTVTFQRRFQERLHRAEVARMFNS